MCPWNKGSTIWVILRIFRTPSSQLGIEGQALGMWGLGKLLERPSCGENEGFLLVWSGPKYKS